jgi:hypothetical protein
LPGLFEEEREGEGVAVLEEAEGREDGVDFLRRELDGVPVFRADAGEGREEREEEGRGAGFFGGRELDGVAAVGFVTGTLLPPTSRREREEEEEEEREEEGRESRAVLLLLGFGRSSFSVTSLDLASTSSCCLFLIRKASSLISCSFFCFAVSFGTIGSPFDRFLTVYSFGVVSGGRGFGVGAGFSVSGRGSAGFSLFGVFFFCVVWR